MRKRLLIGGAVGIAAIATVVYGWGAGWYQDPCNPVLTLLSNREECTALIRFDNSRVHALALHPDGSVAAVTGPTGPNPQGTLTFLTLSPQDGAVRSRTPIRGLRPGSDPMSVSVNKKGTQFALGLFQQLTRVFDLRTGEPQRTIPFASVGASTFTNNGTLVIDRGYRQTGGIPAAGTAVAFNIEADPPTERPLRPEDTSELYTSDLDSAISRDGRYLARNAPTPATSDSVRIQISRVDTPDRIERTLTANLSRRCSYPLTEMVFSPNGTRIAASFDCSYRWGETAQALIVWDLSSGHEIGFFPTHFEWRDILWLNNERLIAARFNLDTKNTTIYRLDLNSGR